MPPGHAVNQPPQQDGVVRRPEGVVLVIEVDLELAGAASEITVSVGSPCAAASVRMSCRTGAKASRSDMAYMFCRACPSVEKTGCGGVPGSACFSR